MGGDLQADIEAIQRTAAVPKILEVICRSTGMGFSAVARVTDKKWICCAVRDEIQFGLRPGGELELETTICHEIRQSGQPVVIDHVAQDNVFAGHHTPAMYGFQSYISMPILLADGTFFGTLCAIDPRPARLKAPEVVSMFKLFAELIAFHLDAADRLASTEANLNDERSKSELREQFIAVLGHDLRNPLAAIDAGAQLLSRMPLDQKALHILGLIQRSAARMSGLIDHVLDFARGRLGGGITLDRNQSALLEPLLRQVIDECRSSAPDRTIEADVALDGPVDCDPHRIAQLFSNILGNALTHGAHDKPIRVRATADADRFELSVGNAGEPIPAAAMERLFLPFSRGAIQPNQEGLGLGLYIASEIARAHGGRIDVTSTPLETRFTFRMPLG